MFRLPIVKFFNRIFNRVTITVVLVTLQVLWLLWAFWSFHGGAGLAERCPEGAEHPDRAVSGAQG